jgi:hypothetical protein
MFGVVFLRCVCVTIFAGVGQGIEVAFGIKQSSMELSC